MRATLVFTLFLGLGCAGDPSQLGYDEAFQVRNAQFVSGRLPGRAPSTSSMTSTSGMDAKGPPMVRPPETMNGVVRQGQAGKKFSGRASKTGVSIAVALKGVSTGYWVLPLGAFDPQTNEPTWALTSDFGLGIPAGLHQMLLTAIDDDGVAGQQIALKLCVTSVVPDNLHACDPERPPPRAVISLQWDANADLDLQVIGPDKQAIDRSHPMTEDGAGVLDRDSDASCVIDGVRTENVIWNEQMPEGRYGIYVNMFDACKQPAARFRVEVYSVATDKNGDEYLKQRFARGGELLDISANGGSARGLFVSEYRF